MAEKNLKARIVHKHDIEANWLLATGFTPKQGEIIVYDIDNNYSYERIKIGDGLKNVNALPFIGETIAPKLTSITMLTSAWGGESNPYSQVVACNGVNVNSKLDLQPSPEQVVMLQNAGISLMLTNDNGTVTAWAINGKLSEDVTMSVLITEVTVV